MGVNRAYDSLPGWLPGLSMLQWQPDLALVVADGCGGQAGVNAERVGAVTRVGWWLSYMRTATTSPEAAVGRRQPI